MDKIQILNYLNNAGVDRVKIGFADIDGVLRGKTIHKNKFIENLEGDLSFCDVVFGWDSNDALYDNVKVTGWHTGYPDQICRIDISTFRTIPWQDNVPFFLADFSAATDEVKAVCPRSLLRKIRQKCISIGFNPQFSQEFEWFNFKETPQSLLNKQFRNIEPLTPGMFGYSIMRSSLYDDYNNELFSLLHKFDIPVEGLHTETGPGVYEAAIMYNDVLKAADQAVLFKSSVKEIAYRHNILASFMAKWNEELPGCGGHIHQSLWNTDKTVNLFHSADEENKMSEIMKHYLAGQLYCLPHILPLYAPTINSYKRLVEGAWAPTTLTWGIENRTTAVRVINSGEKNARVETRVPGSDTNPYLAMAAALASGIYGIVNKLPLELPATIGNAYSASASKKLPSNLFEATAAMNDSSVARELLGDRFVEHFCATRMWEWRQFSKQVTDWELRRYFEII